MTAGECVASVGMTEPNAGSDLQGIRTSAKRDGDDWIINGSKIYITNGWLTDCCIVVAKTKPDAKRAAHGVSLFLVDADTPGFHKGKKSLCPTASATGKLTISAASRHTVNHSCTCHRMGKGSFFGGYGQNWSKDSGILNSCTVPPVVPELPLTFPDTIPCSSSNMDHMIGVQHAQLFLALRQTFNPATQGR